MSRPKPTFLLYPPNGIGPIPPLVASTNRCFFHIYRQGASEKPAALAYFGRIPECSRTLSPASHQKQCTRTTPPQKPTARRSRFSSVPFSTRSSMTTSLGFGSVATFWYPPDMATTSFTSTPFGGPTT